MPETVPEGVPRVCEGEPNGRRCLRQPLFPSSTAYGTQRISLHGLEYIHEYVYGCRRCRPLRRHTQTYPVNSSAFEFLFLNGYVGILFYDYHRFVGDITLGHLSINGYS